MWRGQEAPTCACCLLSRPILPLYSPLPIDMYACRPKVLKKLTTFFEKNQFFRYTDSIVKIMSKD